MRAGRVVVIVVGWLLALAIAYLPLALVRVYGMENVGWVFTAICLIPLAGMVVVTLVAWNKRRASRGTGSPSPSEDGGEAQ